MFEHPGGALALMALIHRARKAAAAADLDAMRTTAGHLLRQLAGDTLVNADEQEMTRLYDEAFPLTDPTDPADVLDAPWPTSTRMQALSALLDERSFAEKQLDPLVDAALDAGDRRVLRAVALTPFGRIHDASWALLLDALQAAGELDDEIVARVVADEDLLRDLVRPADPVASAATGDRFRPAWDEHMWQLVNAPDVNEDRLLTRPRPRGLRFVLWALDYTGNWRVARHLGAAELTATERAHLIELLRDAPAARQEQAFTLRLGAGDAQALLPVLGLAGAERLLRLIQSGQAVNRVVRNDRAAILTAAAEARDADLGRLLKLASNDVVAAALGLRRRPIMTRVGKDSPVGITAYGMLPLADGETVMDRWVALREVHRRGMELSVGDRRRQHEAAVNVALEHLAQVGGYADAAALDAAGEADWPTPVPPPLAVGPYTATVGFDGSEPAIVTVKGARVLKSTPTAVSADPGLAPLREQHELLRGHTTRLRTMLHRLVTAGRPLPPAELARLRATPAGAALLPLLVWQDAAGRFGLLDDVDATGPVTAAHPAALAAAGLLGRWQSEAARRRLCQPVPQLFREWYAPTPQEAAGEATRLSDRVIDGDAASRELAVRGWTVHDGAQPYASRTFGTRTAVLHVAAAGYWGAGDVGFTRLEFRDGDRPVAADGVPAAVFSEAVRDLDQAAWAGRRSVDDYRSGLARARAELLSAALGDDTKRITRHGDTVVVDGARAVYRVHLGTEAVTVGTRRQPCDLPYVFGDTLHRALFPTVDGRDRATLRLLTRILLLAEDEKITDEWTLEKLGLMRRTPKVCSACGGNH
ncbi:DUF4132 domain-containing protein [Catellatospora chokoriensis]|uniref:DUF4132 domain-containing protein n=1 Tax=Catellatospora chokoriensis TaxID=310353 RepID=A0A8J3JWH0_9ACTN|nr:DUF4132 domain-containing protein [Catellatospora chokoriensis]GIF92387.1 hypothetical protein Cch02nite_58310 [Catellatospora chokoriensis]